MALQFRRRPATIIHNFGLRRGQDFTTEASKVESSFSPDTKNMLQNRNGYVEKRTGTRRVFEPGATGSDGKINGIFEYNCPDNNQTYHFIHIGTKLYRFSFGADKPDCTRRSASYRPRGQKEPLFFHRRRALYHRCGLYQNRLRRYHRHAVLRFRKPSQR